LERNGRAVSSHEVRDVSALLRGGLGVPGLADSAGLLVSPSDGRTGVRRGFDAPALGAGGRFWRCSVAGASVLNVRTEKGHEHGEDHSMPTHDRRWSARGLQG
jgi:hypothetical protein